MSSKQEKKRRKMWKRQMSEIAGKDFDKCMNDVERMRIAMQGKIDRKSRIINWLIFIIILLGAANIIFIVEKIIRTL